MASKPKLKGIIFDMDGTLTKPQNYMFAEMREALGISKQQDILKSIDELPDSEQEAAHDKIRRIERNAMGKMEPQPGLSSLMRFLDTTNLQKGICTRNFKEPVAYLLKTHLKDHHMAVVLSREFTPPKPSPDPLLHICTTMDIDVESCIMVGDGADDIISAQAAGMDTILLRNKENSDLEGKHGPTHVVDSLEQIIDIVKARID